MRPRRNYSKVYCSNDQEAAMRHLERAEAFLEQLKAEGPPDVAAVAKLTQEAVAAAKVHCWELYRTITNWRDDA